MSSRPTRRANVLLAMDPVFTEGMFDARGLQRLSDVAALQSMTRFIDLKGGEAVGLLRETDILLTGWGAPTVDEETLALAPRLRAIVHAGGSVKPYVSKHCFERGVAVSSAAAANAEAVAEFTLAAILWGNKRVLSIALDYRHGRSNPSGTPFAQIQWERAYPDLGNHRKQIGVVGASRVGRRVISLLQAFDLEVLVFDPHLDDPGARALGATKTGLDELCERSDTVTLHAPELQETQHMISAARLSRMKDGSVLINTARASLIDMRALERELEAGRLFAILDCTEPFHLPPKAKLHSLSHAFLTPHIAGSLGNEKARLLAAAVDEIARWARGESFSQPVRLEDLNPIA